MRGWYKWEMIIIGGHFEKWPPFCIRDESAMALFLKMFVRSYSITVPKFKFVSQSARFGKNFTPSTTTISTPCKSMRGNKFVDLLSTVEFLQTDWCKYDFVNFTKFFKCMRKNIYYGVPNYHWVCHSLRERIRIRFAKARQMTVFFRDSWHTQ